MLDRCSIIFDYVPGRDKQNADSTEAAIEILLFGYVLRGFSSWEQSVVVESDGCCAQFWCKERFSWHESWVRPYAHHAPPSQPLVLVEVAREFEESEQEVAEFIMAQDDPAEFIRALKALMALILYEANRNAEYHGKSIVDAIGHLTNKLITEGNVAPIEVLGPIDRAKDAATAVELLHAGGVYCEGALEGGLRGLNSPVPSERKRIKGSGQRWELMPLEFIDIVAQEARPCAIKTLTGRDPGTGEGSSTWYAIQHHASSPQQPRTRSFSCSCDACAAPDGRGSVADACSNHARLGPWKEWRLVPLMRAAEAQEIVSFVDSLEDGNTVAMTVPEEYEDDAEYWLFHATRVAAVGNPRGVKDSVGQHVKRGDSMLHGFFLERLVWSTPDNPVYRRDTTDAAMDARHLLRDARLVDDDLESRRLNRPEKARLQTRDEAHDGNQYQLTQERHDAIMELIEPLGIDDDRAPPV